MACAGGDARRAELYASGAGVAYLVYSAWRLGNATRYLEALRVANDKEGSNVFSDIFATSAEFIFGNYVILLVFALAIMLCARRAITKADPTAMRWSLLGTVGCLVALAFSFVNLLITGSLCSANPDDCQYLNATFFVSILSTIILLALYAMSLLTSWNLSKSPQFKIRVDSYIAGSPSTLATHQTSPSGSVRQFDLERGESKRNNTANNNRVDDNDDDDVPYAVPVE